MMAKKIKSVMLASASTCAAFGVLGCGGAITANENTPENVVETVESRSVAPESVEYATRSGEETPIAVAELPETDERVALPFPPGITVESQCGLINDLKDVEFYNGEGGVSVDYVTTHAPSTVQLQWLSFPEMLEIESDISPGNVISERWCSGVLFKENYILTAGHCFDTQEGGDGWVTPFRHDANGDPDFLGPFSLAKLLRVNFNYQVNGENGQLRADDPYPILRMLEYREGGENLDYAIVEIGANETGQEASDTYPSANIVVRPPKDGEQLAIIQHPQGKPKKIADGSHLISNVKSLYYNNIDTFGGSSGSAVRDHEGNVIGVHTNGGCRIHSTSGANRGVHTPAIAAVSDEL